jgi:hypothetical protein
MIRTAVMNITLSVWMQLPLLRIEFSDDCAASDRERFVN